MEFIAALNEVPNKIGPRLFIYVFFLFLPLEESDPPDLSENFWKVGLKKIWSIAFFNHIG